MELVQQVVANLAVDSGKAEKGIGAILMALRMNLDPDTFKQVKHHLPNCESLMGRALMSQPKLLMLDEPSAGLSPTAAETLFDHIVAINRDGLAIALVEQSASDALAISHRAYVLVDGRNSRSGPARELAADSDIKRLFLGA